MFTQRGAAPLHLVLTTSGWSTDERLLLLEPLLAAGAATNLTVAGGSLVGICMPATIHLFKVLLHMNRFKRF